MKTIIAGSRNLRLSAGSFTIDEIVKDSGFDITEVVSGRAKGIDHEGELWAKLKGIPVKMFPADWTGHGKAAGPMRNAMMADYADACIVIWDGESKGSLDMIFKAERAGIPLFIANMGEKDFNPLQIGLDYAAGDIG